MVLPREIVPLRVSIKKNDPDTKCFDQIKAKVNKGPLTKPFKEIAFPSIRLSKILTKFRSD